MFTLPDNLQLHVNVHTCLLYFVSPASPLISLSFSVSLLLTLTLSPICFSPSLPLSLAIQTGSSCRLSTQHICSQFSTIAWAARHRGPAQEKRTSWLLLLCSSTSRYGLDRMLIRAPSCIWVFPPWVHAFSPAVEKNTETEHWLTQCDQTEITTSICT